MRLMAGVGGAALVLGAGSALAQASHTFSIPSESLQDALRAFGSATQTQVLFDGAAAKGKLSSAVVGTFVDDEALKILLQGTNLTFRKTGAGVYLISVSAPARQSTANEPAADDTTTVIVVGSRASQQSAINRKKKANTAVDSIVADDVGSFPDRNLNEAISRIAGMGINRGETGEGEGLSLRGNGADLTRVEMDGMSVNSSGFGLATGDTSGRASDLKELPADLIKSVDVVKGQTADRTEGGLGGSVQIQTRSGLDFKKPYISMRIAGERNTLSHKWSPDVNLVASRKFFNDRLGVIFNLSARRFLGDSHQAANAGGNNWGGYLRAIDLDNSPDKTFTYNPALASNSNAAGVPFDQPISQWDKVAGGKFASNSALDILTKSAATKTKADCVAAFPLYTEAELNSVVAGGSNNTRRDMQGQRIKEQLSCLNQWNDYTPQIVRETWLQQYEDRVSWDIRFDYKITDKFTMFLKYQEADRHQLDSRSNRTQGGVQILTSAAAGATNLPFTSNGPVSFPVNTPMTMDIVPGSGYYLYNAGYTTAGIAMDNTTGSTTTNNTFPVIGQAVNIVPGSIVMDKNHHVTSMQLGTSTYQVDHIRNDQMWDNRYIQTGGTYRGERLLVEFMASHSDSAYTRYDKRVQINAPYGTVTMKAQDNGIWKFDFPANFDVNNPANYVTFSPPSGTVAQQQAAALYTPNIQLGYGPRIVENGEDQGKVDVTYAMDKFPFLKRFKTGLQYRKTDNKYWNSAGYSPVAGVFVPTRNLRSQVRACENQTTTTAINACVYGYVPSAMNTLNFNYGTETLTKEQLTNVIASSVIKQDGAFMPGYEGSEGMKLWNSLDLDKMFSQLQSAQNYTFDCVKTCKGSDGKVYPMPVNLSSEEVTSAYYMFDFEQPLPWGMELDGNFGTRMVHSKVAAAGFVSVNSIRKITNDPNPANNWNATNNNNKVTTTSITKPVSIEREFTDWLPSFNYALWVVPNKVVTRYNWSRNIARPGISFLWPVGTCTVDERIEDRITAGEDELDQICDKFGNPDLRPYNATNNNYSVEWYANKDTFISVSYYNQKVRVDKPLSTPVIDQPLFAGSEEVDPVTGRKLSDFTFNYTTFINGPGYSQSGLEISTKTAFTFLPWKFKYTGADFNYSTNKSNGGGYIDPIDGTSVGAANRPDYTANLSLWYDDGRTNARISYQTRSDTLECVSSCSRNDNTVFSFPNSNPLKVVDLPYNPGEPFYIRHNAYLDAKVTYKLNKSLQLYWEGRNLLYEANVRIGTKDRGFSDISETPWYVQYGGRRFTVGLIYKMQ
jgi:TonB-dependent receptor